MPRGLVETFLSRREIRIFGANLANIDLLADYPFMAHSSFHSESVLEAPFARNAEPRTLAEFSLCVNT